MATVKKIQIGRNGEIYDIESYKDVEHDNFATQAQTTEISENVSANTTNIQDIQNLIANIRIDIQNLQTKLTELENSLDGYNNEETPNYSSNGSNND